MHCFLQYGQGCIWQIRVIHLGRPPKGVNGGRKKLANLAFL